MTGVKRVVAGTLAAFCVLAFAHAWLNLGFDPMQKLGFKKEVVEEARFKVGFLPVT